MRVHDAATQVLPKILLPGILARPESGFFGFKGPDLG